MAREAEMIETYVRGKEAIRQVNSSKLSHFHLVQHVAPGAVFSPQPLLPTFY